MRDFVDMIKKPASELSNEENKEEAWEKLEELEEDIDNARDISDKDLRSGIAE